MKFFLRHLNIMSELFLSNSKIRLNNKKYRKECSFVIGCQNQMMLVLHLSTIFI